MMESTEHNGNDATTKTSQAMKATCAILALSDASTARHWAERIAPLDVDTCVVQNYQDACARLARQGACIVLIDPSFDNDHGMKLARHIHRCRNRAKMMLVSSKSSFELAVDALRLGMIDVISTDVCDDDLRYAVEGAIVRIRDEQAQIERINRLRETCRSLSASKQETTRQVEILCQDLANAYDDITDQISEAAMISEFRTLLAQELDLEELLRTTLEYLLTKTGPTNAAVFLPDGEHGYELGAYVNYDCPREDAEVLLEHLCQVVCPVMEDEHEVVRLDDHHDVVKWVGEESSILIDANFIAFTCREEKDPLAIMVLFRDEARPFEQRLVGTLDALRTIFARQVASVIRVHHRARPQWPVEPAEDGFDVDDEFGFAA